MDIEHLIENAFAGRPLSGGDVQVIAKHVANASFDPLGLVYAGQGLAGIEWDGSVLTRLSRIPTSVAHYLKHVRLQEEWPIGTTFLRYLDDAEATARDPQSGIFISYLRQQATVGAIGHTPVAARGPQGGDWLLVEYKVRLRHWATVFQPYNGIAHIQSTAERSNLRWLRQPQRQSNATQSTSA